jgi:Putative peptidoglycan binding domain
MAENGVLTEPPSKGDDPDQVQDDWLGETGDHGWVDTSEQTVQVRDAVPGAPLTDDGGRTPGDERAFRDELIRRRRMIAIGAAALVVLLAIIIPLIVFSGGSSGHKTPTVTNTTPTTPLTPTTPAATTPATPALKVTLPSNGTLRSGDSDAHVKTLQKVLAALALKPGKADGTFGPSTEAAVIAFQKAHNLPQDGVVGKVTAAKLNAALAAQ